MRTQLLLILCASCGFAQSSVTTEKVSAIKADIAGQIDSMKKQAQVMVDTIFSFGELGFQEF
jgi:aminobenzoyl-glutamate utilization protein B